MKIIREFDQNSLKNNLIKLSGEELDGVASSVIEKSEIQLKIVDKSIADFNDILGNIRLMNNSFELINSNVVTLSNNSEISKSLQSMNESLKKVTEAKSLIDNSKENSRQINNIVNSAIRSFNDLQESSKGVSS